MGKQRDGPSVAIERARCERDSFEDNRVAADVQRLLSTFEPNASSRVVSNTHTYREGSRHAGRRGDVIRVVAHVNGRESEVLHSVGGLQLLTNKR